MWFSILRSCAHVVAIASGLTLVWLAPATSQEKGGKAVVASVKIPSLNPLHPAAAVGQVSAQLYGTLLRMDEDWELQPNLAKSWQVSDNGLQLTFKLHPKAQFHDGSAITSADVKWSIENSVANHRFGTAMFGAIGGIETPNAQTIVVSLVKPSPAILRSMTSPRFLPILPKAVYGDGQKFMKHPRHADPVGSGPFKLSDNGLPSYLVLEPFEGWVNEGPYLDQVVFQVVGDQSALRVGFQRGEFHLASGSALSTYRDLAQYDELDKVVVDPCCEATGSIFAMDMNNRKPPLDDARGAQGDLHGHQSTIH